ncbi:MAG: hypothetical protein RR086_03775 [Clostridia bacterium]
MKKIIFVVIFIVGLLFSIPTTLEDTLTDKYLCTVYCKDSSLPYADMGIYKAIECSKSQLECSIACCEEVKGISFTVSYSEENLQELKETLMLVVKNTQKLERLIVVYGYSSRLRGARVIEGRLINVQIAITDNTITVASPIILGSF